MSKRRLGLVGSCIACAFCLLFSSSALAQTLQSGSYRFSESTLGQGGVPNSASANYQGSSSTGDIGVGNSSSTNFIQQGGSQTTADPRLAVTVGSGVSLPQFDYNTPVMGTSTFSVINYTSYGYIVLIEGDAPKNESNHTLTGMNPATTSSVGTEQFGINLVANTAPQSIGANPNQGNFGHGVAASGYDTTNNYKFVNGDTIASAPKSSGQTDFTMSYLVNVSPLTPAGKYAAYQTVVVVGTY